MRHDIQERRRTAQQSGGGGSAEEVPDLYLAADKLAAENRSLKQELVRADAVAKEAKVQWHKFRKERDFHRMHHRRVRRFFCWTSELKLVLVSVRGAFESVEDVGALQHRFHTLVYKL